MRFDILTIFPEYFNSFLENSLIEKAIEKKLIEVHIHDLRK
jgi:tRNA (guanine37-N1)-methyltransferase